MKSKTEKIAAALAVTGTPLFRRRCSYTESNARENLTGRTHYIDTDTLKAFRARILTAYHAADGLLFVLVESVSSRPNHGGYNKRAVVFDVFGNVVTARDNWHRTTAQADKNAAEFVKSFDAQAHTLKTIEERARFQMSEAKRALAALKGK